MQIRPFLFLIIPVVLLLFSCDKDEVRERDYPAIRTQAVNNITAEGARFNAIIVSGDIESITEYGFVWDNTNNLSLQNSEKIMVNGTPGQENFSCEVTFALEAMEEYYVRPYVRSGDFTVYGEVVKFRSLGSQGPEITDFEPKSATWGDTITIYGRNFSNQTGTNVVLFGELEGRILQCSNETLQVIIPGGLSEVTVNIAVEIYGNRATATEIFELIVPGKISSLNKVDVTWSDTLELYGVFPFASHTLKILFDNLTATLIESTEGRIKAIIPDALHYSDSIAVVLSIDGHKLLAPDKIHMIQPGITNVQPLSFGWTDTVTVYGVFHPAASNNKLLFSNVQASLIEVKRDKIRCVVPYTSSHECQLIAQVEMISYQYAPVISLNGPTVTEITPGKAASGNYVNIQGKYFKEGATNARINNQITYVSNENPRSLSLFIPEDLANGPATVEISVYNKKAIIGDKLIIANPAIIDFYPREGFYDDIVTIVGEWFDPDDLIVQMGEGLSEIIEATENQIKIRVPYEAGSTNTFFIWTRGKYIYSNSTFAILSPEILSISPLSVRPGDMITISGNNFNPKRERNQVYLGNTMVYVVSSSENQIQFTVPNITRGNYTVSMYSGAFSLNSPDPVYCQSPWTVRDNLIIGQSYANAVLYDGAVWAFGGQNAANNYQRFSFSGGDHQIFLDCPYYSNMGGVIFNVNALGYYGLGKIYPDDYTKDFYSFDFSDRSWTKLNSFAGNGRTSAFYFSVGDKCYVGGGLNFQDLWEYDVISDQWSYKGDYPGGPSGRAVAFAVDDKAYIIDGKMVWEYSTLTGVWDRKADFPGKEKYLATGFVIGSRIYFGTGCDNYVIHDWIAAHADFWRYEPSSDQWQQMSDIPYPRYAAFGVTYDSKGYVGGGKNGYDELTSILEYDPDFE